jgi:hypothetical protein
MIGRWFWMTPGKTFPVNLIGCMEKISWAPKIRQAKIWQVYQNDALGLWMRFC